jgi:hypothetical protein
MAEAKAPQSAPYTAARIKPAPKAVCERLTQQFLDGDERFPWIWAAEVNSTGPHDGHFLDAHVFNSSWQRLLCFFVNRGRTSLDRDRVVFGVDPESIPNGIVNPGLAWRDEKEKQAINLAVELAERAAVEFLAPSERRTRGRVNGPIIDACRWLERLLENPAYQWEDRHGLRVRETDRNFFSASARLAQSLTEPTAAAVLANDPRDKFIYELACNGIPWKAIVAALKTKPKNWERIDTSNGVKAAANRYAARHQLPKPAPRKAGSKPR